jgi:superfamily I DNA/RNA helicase
MTVHSSKGLEFPVVAIVGLPAEGAENEASLFYVGSTRATDHLVIGVDNENRLGRSGPGIGQEN